MNQGKIIEYIDQGKFVCSFCLKDKGNSLHLLTPLNREVNLSPKRALLISKSALDSERPREELLEKLKQTENRRSSLTSQINVKELWALISDENESFDHKYLAQLAFGEDISDDQLSALVRALFEDHLHFKMKGDCFRPNSEARVNQIIKQREEDALKEERLNLGSAWLKDILQGKEHEPPPCKDEIANLLIQLALYGTESSDFKYAREMLSSAGITDTREARNLLIKIGAWEEDENLELLRLGVETAFTDKQIDESEYLAGLKIDMEGREDLRNLPAMTIDSRFTSDFDDAISLQTVDGTLLLGIHISDVATAIPVDSSIDREAAARVMSLYLPRREIPMLHPKLSRNALSLIQGQDRQAISLLTSFDKNGNLLNYRFVPSVIRVRQRLTYTGVNEALTGNVLFQEMYQLSRHLQKDRIENGSLNISLPELQMKFNADSSFSLELFDQNTPSRMIVAEFMILYNWLAAKFCRDNQIPILYRGQAAPGETLPTDDAEYVYYVFRQRRKLSPLQVGSVPKPHSGLGLDLYTQSTSPIRRYLDLVIQRQIKSFLMGFAPIYNDHQLNEIRMSVEPTRKILETAKRNRIRYWIIKFLNRHREEKFRALVLDELKNKYRIVLTDFMIVAEMRRQSGIIVFPGQEISVKVKKALPLNNVLEFTYIEDDQK